MSSANVKYIPKDAQVIMAILKELGINDFDPRVINQLLEFIYCKYLMNHQFNSFNFSKLSSVFFRAHHNNSGRRACIR